MKTILRKTSLRHIVSLIFLSLIFGVANAGPKVKSTTPTGCPNSILENDLMYSETLELTANSCAGDVTACPSVYFHSERQYTEAVCANGIWAPANAQIVCEDNYDVVNGVCRPECRPSRFFNPMNLEPTGEILGWDEQFIDQQLDLCKSRDGVLVEEFSGIPGDWCLTEQGNIVEVVFWRRSLEGAGCTFEGCYNYYSSRNQCIDGDIPEPVIQEPERCPNAVFVDGKMYDADLQYVDNSCASDQHICPSVYFYGIGAFAEATCNNDVWQQPKVKK